MSYTLNLFFEPAVRRDRMLRYFAGRRYFSAKDDDISYEHPDTGVYFFIKLQCARNMLGQRTVRSAEFEINYNRPSFFGIEAEKELTAFVAAFQPRIEDSQMRGMEDGPYSGEGFLRGWTFGNVFAVYNRLSTEAASDIASMPRDELGAAWVWNSRRAETARDHPSCFIPSISFLRIEGRPRRVAVWPLGMPIWLPTVDHVLLGRWVVGERRYGLVRWTEIQDLARRDGFDTTTDPLKLAYFVTPPRIADWVARVPLIDNSTLERLKPYQIIDDESITAARELQVCD